MSKTPYLSDEKRIYIKEHNIEEIISNGVNNLLRDLPENPNNFLANYFAGLSDDSIQLKKISADILKRLTRPDSVRVTALVEFKGTIYKFSNVANGNNRQLYGATQVGEYYYNLILESFRGLNLLLGLLNTLIIK